MGEPIQHNNEATELTRHCREGLVVAVYLVLRVDHSSSDDPNVCATTSEVFLSVSISCM